MKTRYIQKYMFVLRQVKILVEKKISTDFVYQCCDVVLGRESSVKQKNKKYNDGTIMVHFF